MKTSLKSKLSKLLLGVTLGLGVAVGAAAGGAKANEVKAETNNFSFSSNYKSTENNTHTWSNNIITITQAQGSGTKPGNYTTAPRWYSGNIITFIPADGVTITGLTFTCSQGNACAGTWSVGTGSSNSWSGSASTSFTETHPSTQSRPTSVSITYTSASSGDGDDEGDSSVLTVFGASDLGLTSSYSSGSGSGYSWTKLMTTNTAAYIQGNSNNSSEIHNTVAFSKKIASITYTIPSSNAAASSAYGYIYFGTSSGPTSNGVKIGANTNYGITSRGSQVTVPAPTGNYNYFKFAWSSGAAYYSEIRVNLAAESLSISGDSTVYNGKTITLSASSNGAAVTGVTWSSSNTGVATVSNTGVVTGVGGTASGANVTITAKKDGYEDATKTITVKADTKTLQSISASGATSTFTLGDSFATTGLVVKGTYSHTNGDADSLEDITTGITTSPAAGTKLNTVGPQTVTVNAGGKSTTYSINVNYAAVESIELDYEEGTLGKGAETTLPGVTIEPANANQGYSWGDAVATEGIVYTYDPSTHELAVDANNAVEGTIQFTATATGDSSKTATVVYTVEAAQIANITGVTASATGTIVAKQYVGAAFNSQGFSFAPTWSEGEHDAVLITADDISWNALVAGSNPTGTYSCADGDFTVTITGVTVVNDTLVSIAFVEGCDMTNKSYYVGDSWDFSGLSIVGTMDSGKTAPAIASSNVTFSSNDAVATDTTSITVTAEYNNLTATKEISGIVVNEVTLDSLTVTYTGGKPYLGADFVFAGTIKGNMSNGTQQNVSVSDVDFDVNPYITDQQTVTATHKTTGATGTFNVQYQVKSYTEDVETSGSASWTANKNDNLYKNQSSTSGTLDVGIFSFNWEDNGYNGWGGDTDGHRLGQSTTGSITFTSSTPTNVKITGITVVCGGNKSASSGSTTVSVGSTQKNPINFSGAGNADREFTFEKATGAIEIEVSCNSLFRMKGITINYVTVEQKPSTEKHAIRIGEVVCTKSPLIAGETLSLNDFNIQVQYDTSTDFVSGLKPTAVSPTTIAAGESTYRVTYTGSYGDTVYKDIQLQAQAAAVLSSITISKDSPCDEVFNRLDDFTHEGIHVIAHYTDSTTYPDADVTESATITPPDMTTAGTKQVSVSYTEGGVTKDTSYSITVNAIHTTSLTLVMKDNSQNVISEGDDGFYEIQPGISYSLAFTGNGDYDSVSVTGGSEYTKVVGNTTLSSTSTTNEEVTFTATCDQANLPIKVRVIAAKTVTLDSLVTKSKGANASVDGNSGSFLGFISNTASIEITTLNYANPVLDDSELPSALSLSGSFSSGKYTGTITANAVYSGTFKLYVSESGGSDSEEISLSFSVVEDTIQSIKATGYQTNYTVGDSFNYSMTVTATYASTSTRVLDASEYDVDAPALTSRGNKTVTVTLDGTSVQDQFDITVAKPGNLNIVTSYEIPGDKSYKLVTDASQITLDGKYALGTTGAFINANNVSSNAYQVSSTPTEFNLEASATTGEYLIKCPSRNSGKYITNSSKTDCSWSTGSSFFFTQDEDTGYFYMQNSQNSNRFLGFTTESLTGVKAYATSNLGSYPLVYLYKYIEEDPTIGYKDNTTISDELYDFLYLANNLFEDRICGTDANPQKANSEIWDELFGSDEFDKLSPEDKNILKIAVCGDGKFDEEHIYNPDGYYVSGGSKISSDIVITFLQKYDRIYSIYENTVDFKDYLNRFSEGGAGSKSLHITTSFALFGENSILGESSSATWLILTVCLAGLASAGGYFYIRKRKED